MGAHSYQVAHALSARPASHAARASSTVQRTRLLKRIQRAYRNARLLGMTPLPISAPSLLAILRSAFRPAIALDVGDSPAPALDVPEHHAQPLAVMVILPRAAPRLFISLAALYSVRMDASAQEALGVSARELPQAINDLVVWAQRRQGALRFCVTAVACATLVNGALQISETLSAPPDLYAIVESVTSLLSALPF